jgi:hypothetical protein
MVKKISAISDSIFVPVVLMMLIVLAGLWFFYGQMSLFASTPKRLYTTILPLNGNARVMQEFQAKYSGLNRVEIYFAHANDNQHGQIILHLRNDCKAHTNLKTLAVPAAKITHDQFYPFEFSSSEDSYNQFYCLVIENDQVAPSTGVGVYVSGGDSYPAGAAAYQPDTAQYPQKHQTEAAPTATSRLAYAIWLPLVVKGQAGLPHPRSDIGFRLTYRGPVYAMLPALFASLAQNKPYIFGVPGAYAVIFGSYAILLGYFLIIVLKARYGSKL